MSASLIWPDIYSAESLALFRAAADRDSWIKLYQQQPIPPDRMDSVRYEERPRQSGKTRDTFTSTTSTTTTRQILGKRGDRIVIDDPWPDAEEKLRRMLDFRLRRAPHRLGARARLLVGTALRS